MKSHLINMFITATILSSCFHALYYNKNKHKWHHHFLLYFCLLFVLGIGLAWLMYLTQPSGAVYPN
ncbi:MAG: hypothetical protein CSA81_02120 [Acidobacteria bacterium]|nr:MAG: hypothetical protein CSA81_02120 [Acidobacteriota bacterium]PIE91308.1 MAG: hypothetical protein CR997_01645 [Acidobacteriota bacterium]